MSAYGKNSGTTETTNESAREAKIRIDGIQQVVEMLKIADPAFRESLLKRLAQRDKELALTLREELANL